VPPAVSKPAARTFDITTSTERRTALRNQCGTRRSGLLGGQTQPLPSARHACACRKTTPRPAVQSFRSKPGHSLKGIIVLIPTMTVLGGTSFVTVEPAVT
jgi:hypothetical protein